MLTFHKQYSFGLIVSGNAKKTHTDQVHFHFFTLSEKKRLLHLLPHLQKNFSPACMLFLQVASMNVFYSI